MTLVAIDYILIVLVLFVVIRATLRGFVREFLGAAALILGIAAATLFSARVAGLLSPAIADPFNHVLAFLGLFIGVFLIVKLFEAGLTRLVDRINLESLDRAAGFFLGLLEALILIRLFLIVLDVQPFVDPERIIGGSVVLAFLDPVLGILPRLLDGAPDPSPAPPPPESPGV